MEIKVDSKVEVLWIPPDYKGWGFENSTVKKIWVGSITKKTYCVVESEQGHIMSHVEITKLKLIK
jgi:hypothetical protein